MGCTGDRIKDSMNAPRAPVQIAEANDVRAHLERLKRGESLRAADSDDLARVYRFDLAQDSEMISPTIPILMSPGA
jgi:hypothetical protein